MEGELNVRELQTCADPLQYAVLRAEPDWQALGKRLGKQMAAVAKAVKALPAADLLAYEKTGELTVEGFTLGQGDIKVRGRRRWGAVGCIHAS